MSNREKEAYELIRKGKEKQNPSFFSKIFSNRESRLEESLEYFEKAANIFKLEKNWAEAGKSMEACADINIELKQDASQYLLEASHCYSFVDKEKSFKTQAKALDVYVSLGRFQQAGKIQKQIAENYEEDLEFEKAAVAFKKASEFYAMEMNSKSYEQGCLIKYADIMGSMPNNTKCFPECCNVS
jgi:alpha-soluble NSF attachment protein